MTPLTVIFQRKVIGNWIKGLMWEPCPGSSLSLLRISHLYSWLLLLLDMLSSFSFSSPLVFSRKPNSQIQNCNRWEERLILKSFNLLYTTKMNFRKMWTCVCWKTTWIFEKQIGCENWFSGKLRDGIEKEKGHFGHFPIVWIQQGQISLFRSVNLSQHVDYKVNSRQVN